MIINPLYTVFIHILYLYAKPYNTIHILRFPIMIYDNHALHKMYAVTIL